MPSKVSTWSGPYTPHRACWQSAPASVPSACPVQLSALQDLQAGGGPYSSPCQLRCGAGKEAVGGEASKCRAETELVTFEGQAGSHREGQGLDGEPGAARQVEGTHRASGPQQHLHPKQA